MIEAIVRTTAVWLGLLVLFKLSGRRTIGEMAPVDLIAILIIGNVLQNALLDEDASLTGGFTVVVTLLLLGIVYAQLRKRLPWLSKRIEGVPTILVHDGMPDITRLNRTRVGLDDLMEAARKVGILELSGIRYAILENSGSISIIPRS